MRKHHLLYIPAVFLLVLIPLKWTDLQANISIPQDTQLSGADLYAKYCLTCHQASGKGVRNMFPPLAGNQKITGPPDDIIRIVLFGLQGPITVNDRDYNQAMPPQAYLDDKKIADILTYIRSSWGNDAPPVKPADISKIRKEGKK
jgi:mono/diheme cytochrome c family protein